MKMKFAYICLLALVVASCSKKNDRAFDTTPEERINELIDKYQTQLAGGTNGWKALLTSPDGTVYNFFFKFNDKNRVVSYSDFKGEFGVAKESSYRLKALQQISLLFDTYTYLHVLADPDPNVAGGGLGTGYNVDFEFYFDNATADTINLVGRKHASKMRLVRASQAEATSYSSGGLQKAMALSDNYGKILQYWKVFTAGSTPFQMSLDTAQRFVTLFFTNGGNTYRDSSRYYFNGTGMVLLKPIPTPLGRITGFTDITWDAANKSFSMKLGNVTVTMAGANLPVAIERNSAFNFRVTAGEAGTYWYNTGGIRINGVNNAYRTDTLTFNDSTGTYRNYYLFYQPGTLSGTIDGFAPIFLNQAQTAVSLMYGSNCIVDHSSPDGRMILTEHATPLGDFPFPATGGADLWRKWMYNSAGVFLVRIDDETYDMVSASDATSWMRWYLW